MSNNSIIDVLLMNRNSPKSYEDSNILSQLGSTVSHKAPNLNLFLFPFTTLSAQGHSIIDDDQPLYSKL